MRAEVSVETPIPSPTNKITFLALNWLFVTSFSVSLLCASEYHALSVWCSGKTAACKPDEATSARALSFVFQVRFIVVPYIEFKL